MVHGQTKAEPKPRPSSSDALDMKYGKCDILDIPDTSNAAKKNATSIARTLLWSHDGSSRLSHYFAGDARWEVEDIVEWLKPGSTKQAACMKLSHHGAINSTSRDILDVFNPG